MTSDMGTEMTAAAVPAKNKKRDVKDALGAKGGKFAKAYEKRFGKK